MNTRAQAPAQLPGTSLRAAAVAHSGRRNAPDPGMIAQIIGYGLMWLGMLLFAVAVVALAMGRLR